MRSFRSRFTRALYDPAWVLEQIASGYPDMSEADKATALEEACHAMLRKEDQRQKVDMLVRQIAAECGYEVD